jgi:hypothetical protein
VLLCLHVYHIYLQVVLPLLCFDEEDAELWEEDPQEFVRKVRHNEHYPNCEQQQQQMFCVMPACSSAAN